jgi:purine nucleoside phosphorylase
MEQLPFQFVKLNVRNQFKIGIIGGTGFDDPTFLTERTELAMDTPFGQPSDVLISGKIAEVNCVFVSRHGRSMYIYLYFIQI